MCGGIACLPQRWRQQSGIRFSAAPGRYITIQSVLHHFRDWAGAKTTAASITGQTLTRFHSAQLDLISSKQCAPGYAKGRMGVVKSFIRWLWEQDVLEHLPKNVNSRALKTSQQVKSPETCPIADVQTILKRSTGRTRLYVLLALNCGITQQDNPSCRSAMAL